jgi:APA family basic amino acid/polyamine antiporter
MRGAQDIAGAAAAQIFGRAAGTVVTSLVVLAVLSSLQASIVVGPRIYHAMAEHDLFPQRLARLSEASRVPVNGIVLQGLLSALLLLSGKFETLLNFTTFALCLFSIICVLAVPVLRWRKPSLERPFSTPGYPLTPALFVLGNGWVLVNLLASGAKSAFIGLGIVLTGLPAYLLFRSPRVEPKRSSDPPLT